jgi:hypothetical protein
MRGKEGYYYPNTLRAMVKTALGMFDDIIVYKYDKRGNIIDQLEVPVLFGPQKREHKVRNNEDQTKAAVPKFPRIELHLNGYTFDESRIASPNTRRFWDVTNLNYTVKDHEDELLVELNDAFTDFNPLPYNYEFTVNIFTESIDHYSQISENIFPYFAMANSTIRVREFQFLNIERNINVRLGNPDVAIAQDSLSATDRREVTCNFGLTLEGWMYRKVRAAKIIKNIEYNIENHDVENEQLGSGTFNVDINTDGLWENGIIPEEA